MASVSGLTAVRGKHPLCLGDSESLRLLRDSSGNLDLLGDTRTPLEDEPNRDDSAPSCLLNGLGRAAAGSTEQGDAAAARSATERRNKMPPRCDGTAAAVTAHTQQKANIQHFNAISDRISGKLTHQKSHRRLSPAARSKDSRSLMIGRRRGQLRNVVVFLFFLSFTPSRYSIHISTPSSLVLVCDRRRQTSFDVWITWLHS